MSHKKHGFRFENDWDVETLESDWSGVTIAEPIPVNVEIKADQKVIHIDKAKEYLKKAEKIYRLDCECRTKRGNCDNPVETCLMWDVAESTIESDWAKELHIKKITLDEAYKTLKMSHEAGLVHMAYASGENPNVNSLCSCCSCCCAVFSGLLRFGMFKHVLSSDTIQVTDESACISCGQCIDSCHFGAREINDGKLEVNNEICYGCGLCVESFPEQAITILNR